MKSGLQKRKRILRPKLPESKKTTIIDGKYIKTFNNVDKFLIYKSKDNRKLVFMSKTGLELFGCYPIG
jgi:hypothetical protein